MTMTAEQRRRRHDVIARMAAEEDDYPPGGIAARTGDDLTAAGWEPEEHPRGNDGQFIEAGAVVDLLKKATKDLTTNDVNTAVKSLDKKTWDHLKPEQKKHITDVAGKLPTGSDIGAKLTQLEGGKLAAAPKIGKAAPAGKPVTPAIIYKRNPDGFVVAESPDGKKRMRWDATAKKFVVEDENGKQLDSLNKTSAYAAVKDSKRWMEPGQQGQNDTKTGPSEPPQTPEPEAPVVEPAPKPDVAPAAESITPETTPQPEAPNAPTPPYEGPKVDLDQYISKDVQDEVRQLFLEDMMYRLKVDELTGELHKKFPEKYGTGYTGWSDARKDAEAQVEAPNNPTTESVLEKAFPGYGDNYTVRQNIRSRLHNEAQVEASLSRFARHNNLELTDELKADLARRTREAFAGKKIAVRVTPKNLEHILNSGRIKSQFETGKSKGKKDVDMRASVEKTLFGITDKPHQNVEKRPIYGYVALDGVRPVGAGSGELGGVSTDALSQYGNVQVILKDDVRKRTTAMFGDSLNNMHEGMPSPVDDPSWLSFTASRGGVTGKGLNGLERGGDMPGFRADSYAEAEIHGGVSVDDIEEVVLPSASAALQKALDAKGIRWRVLNWKNAPKVVESPEEREAYARIADDDVRAIDDKIAWYHKTWPGDKLTSDLKKEIQKYQELREQAVATAEALRAASKVAPAKKAVKVTPPPPPAAPESSPPKLITPNTTPTEVKSGPAAPKMTTLAKLAEGDRFVHKNRTWQINKKRPGYSYSEISDAYSGESSVLSHDVPVALPHSSGDALTELRAIQKAAEHYDRVEHEITQKANSKVLKPEDIKASDGARKALKALRAEAEPHALSVLDSIIKRDGSPWGSADTQEAHERWVKAHKVSTALKPTVDKAKIDKSRDVYVANDLKTVQSNASLRTGDPTPAAKAWRGRMDSMVNSATVQQDSMVYRGAAFQPEMIAQLRPGAVLHDLGVMSTADTRNDAEFYAGTRLSSRPGTFKTIFAIRTPNGIAGIDVGYGEFVFPSGSGLRIVSSEFVNGQVNVIAEMIPPKKGKK